MNPGVYSDIPNADYHRGPGCSKSLLDLVNRSPLHCKAAMDDTEEREATAAQAFGTAFHSLLLEPGLFVREYTLPISQADHPDAIRDRDQLVAMVEELNADRLPKLSTSGSKADLVARIVEEIHGGDGEAAPELEKMKAADLKATIEAENAKRPGLLPTGGSMGDLAKVLRDNGHKVQLWRDVREEWEANNGHRTILSVDEWDRLHRMRDAVMAHPAARALLENKPGKAEQSAYWIDPETGVLCRCRPDWWRQDNILVDVKTAEDASEDAFARSVANWRYHVQHPFYVDGVAAATGLEPRAFVFLVVEKKPPYAVAVYQLDTESVELGRHQYRQDLQVFGECERTGIWPGYGDRIKKIDLPAWYYKRHVDL